jgi:hypothetical protein
VRSRFFRDFSPEAQLLAAPFDARPNRIWRAINSVPFALGFIVAGREACLKGRRLLYHFHFGRHDTPDDVAGGVLTGPDALVQRPAALLRPIQGSDLLERVANGCLIDHPQADTHPPALDPDW